MDSPASRSKHAIKCHLVFVGPPAGGGEEEKEEECKHQGDSKVMAWSGAVDGTMIQVR